METALVVAIVVLQTVLAIVLLRRKLVQEFRFFFSYTVCTIISQSVSLLLRNHYSLKFYFYWIAETISITLTFFALYEVFHWVFRNFYGVRMVRYAFPVVGMVMMLIAGLRILLWSAPDSDRLISAIISLEIGVGFLEVGLFGLFLLLVWFFHMRWRQYGFGIALGFGIAASADLAVFLLRSEYGTKFDLFLQTTYPIAYSIAVVVWLAAFIPPQPDHPLKNWVPPLSPEQMTAELREYTRKVKGVLRR